MCAVRYAHLSKFFVVGYASNPLNIDDSFRVGRARGYCNDYEDEDELKLNSAQHARSAASRLDDVIDRSALEQAREGSGGRDIEEPLIWTWSPKEHS